MNRVQIKIQPKQLQLRQFQPKRIQQISQKRILAKPVRAATEVSDTKESPEEELQKRRFNSMFQVEEFTARDGEKIQVLAQDLGFKQGVTRLYQDQYGQVPQNMWQLSVTNFKRELLEIRKSVRFNEYRQLLEGDGILARAQRAFYKGLENFDISLENKGWLKKLDAKGIVVEQNDQKAKDLDQKIKNLVLDDHKVAAREEKRVKMGLFPSEAPKIIIFAYKTLCIMLDLIYANKPIQRFWVLETVARMPYFAAISLLHLYESLGWWRAGAVLRQVHFAEDWNELHHLQVMETLGGDRLWFDRFLGEHAAIFYYWVLIVFYVISPKQAYQFSEMIECHAVDTYSEFQEANKEALETIPPPLPAVYYYLGQDIYMFDAFQTGDKNKTFILEDYEKNEKSMKENGYVEQVTEPRRPSCRNLYETFVNIRDDENEHVKTMNACKSGKVISDMQNRKF